MSISEALALLYIYLVFNLVLNLKNHSGGFDRHNQRVGKSTGIAHRQGDT